MPPTVDLYYDKARDTIVVTTTTKAYTLLHSHLNAVAEVPSTPTLADLLEFLQPPTASPEYELTAEPEPLPVYKPQLEYEPMSLGLPPLEPIVPKVPVIEISSSNSPVPASEPLLASDSFESDPFKATSIAALFKNSTIKKLFNNINFF